MTPEQIAELRNDAPKALDILCEMCSKYRGPKMSIPVREDDEDRVLFRCLNALPDLLSLAERAVRSESKWPTSAETEAVAWPIDVMDGAEWNILDATGTRIAVCGFDAEQATGKFRHESKRIAHAIVGMIRNLKSDNEVLKQRAVEAERERDEARQKIKVVADAVTPWMLANKIYGITATDCVKLIADALSAAEAQLRVVREALEAICAKCHGFAVTSDSARLHGVVAIASEALAKIGGGNE